ncbi:SGNH/GDSL hydrolase family protein [Flavivirga sp. 57AJ16]|uniref:SGNH/GDSL hydrolase family protein n=1 Tax=Flavivirga sp. 57AJ16 TaxID=3025307 RepID=UPI0023657A0E|nr:SGNH/GDSL hydrolase family protein [Flavivirga sp. 57AJ16]MDD7884703.1 SGNH/GDSL hydrolase family protein [Flavivirga sp. 57AJ16]
MHTLYAQDWANLRRYQKDNARLVSLEANEPRVVFMGNSITEGWSIINNGFFNNNNYINRGIGGQTTPQMLLRFRQDVIELHPKAVVILAGVNDIAGNTGPSTIDMIFNNIKSMVELAKANKIKVLLCSVLPVFDFPWNPGLKPAKKIIELNMLLEPYASEQDIVYVDYFSAMVDVSNNGLRKGLGEDGVHPNEDGYAIMEPIIQKEIAKALNK